MYIGLHVKYLSFLSDFDKTWIISTHCLNICKYQISRKSVQWEQSCSIKFHENPSSGSRVVPSNFTKIRPVGAELFHKISRKSVQWEQSCSIKFHENPSSGSRVVPSNFTKIRPVGAELFHADGRTWRNQKSLSQYCECAYNDSPLQHNVSIYRNSIYPFVKLKAPR
jgi:hypothetical protein